MSWMVGDDIANNWYVPPWDSLGLDRYFSCGQGRGLFVREKWCRRSFIQRAPRGAGAVQNTPKDLASTTNTITTTSSSSKAQLSRSLSSVFNVQSSPLDNVGVLDMTKASPALRRENSSRSQLRRGISHESTRSGNTLNPVSKQKRMGWEPV